MKLKERQEPLSEVASQHDHRPTRMTLRQYLDTRLQRMMWVGLLSLALTIALSAGLFLLEWRYWFLAPALFFVFIWQYNLNVSNARCPRCESRLGRLAYAYLNAHTGRMRTYHRKQAGALGKCPHCSLRLDEECSASPGN
jgi:DNA-directed RNA polymerase subunit RPC12/RpoP